MNKGDTEEQRHWRKKKAKMDYKYRMTVKKLDIALRKMDIEQRFKEKSAE